MQAGIEAAVCGLAGLAGPCCLRIDFRSADANLGPALPPTCRSWLIARKWDVEHAARDIAAHAAWREEFMPAGAVAAALAASAAGGQRKVFLQGRDRQGQAVVVVKAGKGVLVSAVAGEKCGRACAWHKGVKAGGEWPRSSALTLHPRGLPGCSWAGVLVIKDPPSHFVLLVLAERARH